MIMLTYDNVYSWDGWGGKLRLGNGKCRLRIFDLRKDQKAHGVSFLKPVIVVITDVRGKQDDHSKLYGPHCDLRDK